MRRFSSHGWTSNWDDSKPSVWLTAWVIRIFKQVSHQEWEDYIYIDPMIMDKALMWLLKYQTKEGAFGETEWYPYSLHKPMDNFQNNLNISLTAHVLIALENAAQYVQNKHKTYVAQARQRTIQYLERQWPQLEGTDSYELAITAYALALIRSDESILAYRHLLKFRKEEGGLVYWGKSPIAPNREKLNEFNRSFIEAKDYQDNDALAVEATSYTLLTLFLVEGGRNTILLDKMVQWLNTMRQGDGGFISTVDTVIALDALIQYSYNHRIKDITNLDIEVDIPDSELTKRYHIKGERAVAKAQRLDIPNVWGHVNLEASGKGQAVAQLDVNWGIDNELFKDKPPTDCFQLTIEEFYYGRNKSEIAIKSCFSWTLTKESPTSGMAMLVIDIPSGYNILEPDAKKIIRSGIVPEMRDVDVTKSGKTIWYFDYIPQKVRCFEHTVRRYYPVANLTRIRQAAILEPLRPERFFIRLIDSSALHNLSICDVCGSFQCPYCPFYSFSSLFQPNLKTISFVAFVTLIITQTLNLQITFLER